VGNTWNCGRWYFRTIKNEKIMTAAQKAAKANFKKAIEYRKKTGVSLKEAFAHVYGKKVGAAPKKKAAKKAAPKKAAKKVVKKAAPKKVAKKKHTKYGKVKAHTRRVAGNKIGLSIAKKAAAKVKSLARKAQDAYYEGFYEGKPAELAKKRAELKAKRVSAAKKKVSEKSILNKIHRVKNEVNQLDELQHKHMISGYNKKSALDNIEHNLDIVKKLENRLIEYKKYRSEIKNPVTKRGWAKTIKDVEQQIREHKTHIAQLKKYI
jgi:hypothetical protein